MSTIVTAPLAPGRSIDRDSFADITPATVEDIDMRSGEVVVTFADTLGPAKRAACERRITMTPSVEAAFTALEQRVTTIEKRLP